MVPNRATHHIFSCWRNLRIIVLYRDLFRTVSNIYDGAFLRKELTVFNSFLLLAIFLNRFIQMFDKVLNTPLIYPAGIYMFKVNNRNTRARCEICSTIKLTTETPERRHWYTPCSSVSIVNFEHVISGWVL